MEADGEVPTASFPPLEKRHWESHAISPLFHAATTINKDAFYSNPIVMTSNAGWQPLISVIHSYKYFQWIRKYAKMIHLGHDGITESSNLAFPTIGSSYIVDKWLLKPIGFTVHRLGLAFAVIQQNTKTGNMRVMVFGIDYDRHSEYGIGISPSEFGEDKLHEWLPCIKKSAKQFVCPTFLEFSAK